MWACSQSAKCRFPQLHMFSIEHKNYRLSRFVIVVERMWSAVLGKKSRQDFQVKDHVALQDNALQDDMVAGYAGLKKGRRKQTFACLDNVRKSLVCLSLGRMQENTHGSTHASP